MSHRLARRAVLQGLSAAGVAALLPRRTQAVDSSSADRAVAGKDPRLVVHKASPAEIETPVELLAEHDVTPKEILFVRNNGVLAGTNTLQPHAGGDDWKIEFTGLVEYPRSIDLSTLRGLPTVERTMVVQCSGNGRKFYSAAAPCPGSPWSLGAVANLRFAGVPLRAVLEKLAIEVDPRAKFVTVEGADAPAKPEAADFEHSLPSDDVLERSLLALSMNGEPLPAVHGGPVRFVTPGYYGTMHVKWPTRIRFESAETANHHQVHRYRTPRKTITPGSPFEYGLENSEPNWRMRIKSLVLAPADRATVQAGRVAFRGVAFNDGACAIERVETSLDGDTWTRAELKRPADLCAWYPWQATHDLPTGEHTLRARAVDAQGRTQPLDGAVFWNPAGYCWNGVHQVRIVAT